MGGQRKLDEHSAYCGVLLELSYFSQKFLFRGVRRKFEASVANADFIAGLEFKSDVKFALC